MKKFFRAAMAMVLSAVMCLGLCGCNTDIGTMLLMKKVYESIEETESFEADIKADLKMKVQGISSEIPVKAECRFTEEPAVMELLCSTESGLLSEVKMPVYFIGGDDALEVYAGVPLFGNMVWLHESLELPEGTDTDAKSVLKMLDEGSGLKITKGEQKKIGGETAVKLTLVLPGDMIAVSLGAMDETMDDLVVTGWVSKKSGQVLRLEAELGDLAQLALKQTEFANDSKSIEIESMTVVIDVTGRNTVQHIELPEDTAA